MMKIGYLLIVLAVLLVLAIDRNDFSTLLAIIGTGLVISSLIALAWRTIHPQQKHKSVGVL